MLRVEAHLPPPRVPVLRANAWGQAYRLTEAPPSREPIELVRWLAVDKHARYRAIAGTTYCNVYAHDYCNLRGAYLPRVWWGQSVRFVAGVAPSAVLGKTVFELSANALFEWLDARSADFGWRRLQNVDEAQSAANANEVVVICARRKLATAPGHIAVVLPEGPLTAIRERGDVVKPVQSQAGGRNFVMEVPGKWWLGPEMAEWGAWAHPASY